jgi:hypothetical protein
MARKKKEKVMLHQNQSSFFKKAEINSISDILNIYLFFDLTQELVNAISQQTAVFLLRFKGIDASLIEQHYKISFTCSRDKSLVNAIGLNLLSSLWIIGVYPNNPETLVDKVVYIDGDFIYRFYTENQNLSITKTKPNESKPTGDPRDRKVPKRTQRKG